VLTCSPAVSQPVRVHWIGLIADEERRLGGTGCLLGNTRMHMLCVTYAYHRSPLLGLSSWPASGQVPSQAGNETREVKIMKRISCHVRLLFINSHESTAWSTASHPTPDKPPQRSAPTLTTVFHLVYRLATCLCHCASHGCSLAISWPQSSIFVFENDPCALQTWLSHVS
jgi:hypothetical protein